MSQLHCTSITSSVGQKICNCLSMRPLKRACCYTARVLSNMQVRSPHPSPLTTPLTTQHVSLSTHLICWSCWFVQHCHVPILAPPRGHAPTVTFPDVAPGRHGAVGVVVAMANAVPLGPGVGVLLPRLLFPGKLWRDVVHGQPLLLRGIGHAPFFFFRVTQS